MARILVIDDEPNVRKAFEAILSAKGHEVLLFESAEEALARLEREAYRFSHPGRLPARDERA